jgi:hypothetical protein
MYTPITVDVKHKWMKLDKRVIKILLDIEYNKYI